MKWTKGQPQAGAAPDALDGFSSHCAGDQLKLGANVAQVVPVSAAWRGDVAAHQFLSTDFTYIRLERGFAYLVPIMDWYSRRVLS